MSELLFVYGTLASGHPARQPFAHYFGEARPASTRGRLVHLPEGYPTLLPGEGTVFGELVTLVDPVAALAALDDYEDAGGADPLYRRVRQAVEVAGRTEGAWVYVWGRAPEDALARGTVVDGGRWRG